jgi:adhesin HecA-like repeat protein
MQKTFTPLWIGILCLSSTVSGQTTAIRAARMVDVRNGTVVSNAVVLVEKDRIQSAGAGLGIPSGAKTIDLGDATLLPGLIDSHTHLLQTYDMAWLGTPILSRIRGMTTVNRVLLGAGTARDVLEGGTTTVRDLGNSGVNGDVALRDAIEDGWVIGPRMLVSTRALIADDGKPEPRAPDGPLLVKIRDPEDARQAVRQAVKAGADCIKIYLNGPPLMPLEQVQAIVEEAHRSGKKVAAHAVGEQATRIAAQAGVDSIEHAYAHFQQEFGVAALPDDVLKIMAEKHIFLVPTDGTLAYVMDVVRNDPPQGRARIAVEMRKYGEADAGRLRRAIQAGIPFAAGSDHYVYNSLTRFTRRQMLTDTLSAYAEGGVSPLEIIRAATINAAELLSRPDLGAIEANKLADIIAVAGDPLKDISQLQLVQFVMKGGQIIRNDH